MLATDQKCENAHIGGARCPSNPPEMISDSSKLDTLSPVDTGEFAVRRLGQYELLEPIGRGNSSIVYRARSDSGQIVAVKVLLSSVARNEDRQVRFYQEAQAMMQIEHSNVIAAYEVGEGDEQHFLAMEYVDGKTLGELLKEKGRLSEKNALKAAICLARALAAAHRQGILHRDVSLKNIMISQRGEVKLGDFEYSKAPARDLDITMDGRALGTPDFMSPEQFHRAKDVDERSDIYSIGVALYYLATGRSPFPGETYVDKWIAKTKNHYLHPTVFAPRMSKPTRALIMRAMAARPDDRIQSAKQFERAAIHAFRNLQSKNRRTSEKVTQSSPKVAARTLPVWTVTFLNGAGQARYFNATREQILQLIDSKQLPADARATLQGQSDYRRLVDIPEFRSAVKASGMQKTINRLSSNGKNRVARWLQSLGDRFMRTSRTLADVRRR